MNEQTWNPSDNNYTEEGIEGTTQNIVAQISSPVGLSLNEKKIFIACVITVGILGCVANGTVLSAFVSKKILSNALNKFMMNQVVLDMFASVFIVVNYAAKMNDLFYIYPEDITSELLCRILVCSMLPFIGFTGSTAGIVVITLDRYFKIVFPLAHRKHFKAWLIPLGMIFPWIVGILLQLAGTWTSGVYKGKCYKFAIWPSIEQQMVYSIISFGIQYFIPLVLFFVCYNHILIALRGQNKVTDIQAPVADNPTHNVNNQGKRRQEANIVKTMVTISMAFIVCCSPNQVLYLLISCQASSVQASDPLYYFTVFLLFCNVAVNPFIYAIKHDAVKNQLIRHWLKNVKSSDTQTNNVN